MRTFTLNARQLREAIAAGAEYVTFSVPAKEDKAVIITGLVNGFSQGHGQLSWAAVMPLTRVKADATPKLAVPKPQESE